MEFVGYTNRTMIDLTDKIYSYKENYVFNDEKHIKLAIKLSNNHYSLYTWDEYNEIDNGDVDSIIESKSKETIRLFQETIGLYNTILPTSIYQEVQNILRYSGCSESYNDNCYTDLIKAECGVTLECDYAKNTWFVKIGNIVFYALKNENAAQRIFALITKDISNYISHRWKRI